MAHRLFRFHTLLFILGFVFIYLPQMTAQSVWILPEEATNIRIEYLKPTFAEYDVSGGKASTIASIYSINFRAKLSDRFFGICELPFMKVTFPQYFSSQDIQQSGIANILIGFEYKTSSSSFIEFGARIPTISEKNSSMIFVGWLGDIERWEAYVPKQTALTLAGNYLQQFESGIVARVRCAPSVWIQGSDQRYTKSDGTAFVIDASGGIGYIHEYFDIGMNFASRSAISPDEIIFNNDQTQFNLGLGAGYRFRSSRIGLYYRAFINDNPHVFKPNEGVFGVNVSYAFND